MVIWSTFDVDRVYLGQLLCVRAAESDDGDGNVQTSIAGIKNHYCILTEIRKAFCNLIGLQALC